MYINNTYLNNFFLTRFDAMQFDDLPDEMFNLIFDFIYPKNTQIETNPQKKILFSAQNQIYILPTKLDQSCINNFFITYKKSFKELLNISKVNKHLNKLTQKRASKTINCLLKIALERVIEEETKLCGYLLMDAFEITKKLFNANLHNEIVKKLTNEKPMWDIVNHHIDSIKNNQLSSIRKAYKNEKAWEIKDKMILNILERMQLIPLENSKAKKKFPFLSLEKLFALYSILLSVVTNRIHKSSEQSSPINFSYTYLNLTRKIIADFVKQLNGYEKGFLLGRILKAKQPKKDPLSKLLNYFRKNNAPEETLTNIFQLGQQPPSKNNPKISHVVELLLFPHIKNSTPNPSTKTAFYYTKYK